MAVQLVKDPEIKINGEKLEGYICKSFTLTKRLLEPNRFEFVIRKEDMSFMPEDISFEIRDKLLGALVECSLTGRRSENGEWVEDKAEKFFKGYIQNIRTERISSKTPMLIHCVAFSADAHMKAFPDCSTCIVEDLENLVWYTISNFVEKGKLNDNGYYTDTEDFDCIVQPRDKNPMPYTVQYNESCYDYLVRLAKRYGEFFYSEEGKIIFGEMKEYDPITLRTGQDLETYDYDICMSHHCGIMLNEYDHLSTVINSAGKEKAEGSWKNEFEHVHSMEESAYNQSINYYTNVNNIVYDEHSARIMDDDDAKSIAELKKSGGASGADVSDLNIWVRHQRRLLEKYIMADAVKCSGVAKRADLKLGSVIIIEDETNKEGEKNEYVQHEPLKIIDLTYTWSSSSSRTLTNKFKAIPQKSDVPPYLERDEKGFLTYGNFDVYPHCGPQHALVYDNKDPEGLGRVRVALIWQRAFEKTTNNKKIDDPDCTQITPWIRIAEPYGGWHRGAYLIPEIGDEVMVGFEYNNAERPYVMGCMYNILRDYPVDSWVDESAVENNEYKAIRTRNGHTIEIRDKGEQGYIKIYDENTHNYVVTYDTDKKLIRLESKGNIELKASSNIVLNAGNNIIMDAKNNIESTAKNDMTDNVGNNLTSNVGNNREVMFGNEYAAFIKDTEKQIRLNKKHAMMSMKPELSLAVNETKGIMGSSDSNIEFSGNQKVGMASKQQLILKSDMTAELTAKTSAKVEGSAETIIKGGVVKIN